MRQQREKQPIKAGHISEEVIQELRKKTFDELSDELFLMGDGEGQDDLMDVYVQLMQEKCPPDDGSFDFKAAMDEVKKRIAKETDTLSSKYDFLQTLTMENLELLLKAGDSYYEVESLLDAVRKEAMRRGKNEPVSNKVQSIPSDGMRKKSSHKRKVLSLRTLGGIAALVVLSAVLTVGCMVGAQASGLNVFGALAEWTDDFFHYVPSQSANNPVRIALIDQGIPGELAPTQISDRFVLKNVDSFSNDEGNYITVEYIGEDEVLGIEFSKFNDPIYLAGWDCQKDSGNAKPFVSHERQFYILWNDGDTTATWSDDQSLLINIWGNISTEEMMEIVSSIGG